MNKKYFISALMASAMLSSTAMAGYDCQDTCVDGFESPEGQFYCEERGWACTDTASGVVFTSQVETACKDVSGTKICINGSASGVSGKTEFNSDGSVTSTNYHGNGQVSMITTQQGTLSYLELDSWGGDSVAFEIDGEVTQSSTQYYDTNGDLQGYSQKKYEDGEITEEKTVNQSDSPMIIGYHDKYGAEYFPANKEVETIYEGGETRQQTTTTYNSDNSYQTVSIICDEGHAGCYHYSSKHGESFDGSGSKTTTTYDANGVIQSEILELEDSQTITEYENGIPVSKKEIGMSGECYGGMPCDEENDAPILAEYEFDAQGNVTAVWKNVPIKEEYHECWEECEDYDEDDNCIGPYEQCEDGEEVTGYYKEKYAADGKTKLGKYDSNGELIESYEKTVKELKRIFTVEEALAVSGPKNRFRIRYK